jgi:hypothetical protein
MGWHGLARLRIRYPLLANAVQRLLTAMVGQDREEANRLQQANWELTSRIRDESNVPNAFHFSRRSPLFTRFLPSGSRRGVGDDGSGWVGGLTNERDFSASGRAQFPPGGFRSVFLEIDAFHRERRIPVRAGIDTRSSNSIFDSVSQTPPPARCIPKSLRW